MSKKPQKSRHRVPLLEVKCDPIDEQYQAEIDQSIARLEARYRKVERALAEAEIKAERSRVQAEKLARKQAQAEAIAANRLENERKLSEHIACIKEAAKNARLAEARAKLERQQREVIQKRNAETARRRAEAKEIRERHELLAKSRSSVRLLEAEVAERRRELKQIELLMMPGNYAGRIHRSRSAQHQSGGAA
jgi:chromosome segregation ATPase